jgi:hypothetical protein
LDEKCKKLEKKTIQRVATNTIGYTRKQANKEFDEECAEVNEENNATRERVIQHQEEPRMLTN